MDGRREREPGECLAIFFSFPLAKHSNEIQTLEEPMILHFEALLISLASKCIDFQNTPEVNKKKINIK